MTWYDFFNFVLYVPLVTLISYEKLRRFPSTYPAMFLLLLIQNRHISGKVRKACFLWWKKFRRKRVYSVFTSRKRTKHKRRVSFKLKKWSLEAKVQTIWEAKQVTLFQTIFFNPLKVLTFKNVISERKYASIFLDIPASKTVENSCTSRFLQPVFSSVQGKIISSYSDYPPQPKRILPHFDINYKTSANWGKSR